MSEQIRVAVQGALGRMGQEILATLAKEPDMLPVGGADHFAKGDSLALPGALRHDSPFEPRSPT